MQIIRDFFSWSPIEGFQQCRHNRACGCPAPRGGRVLLCCDGLNRMSLNPDLASRLTKGPFVTLGKECCRGCHSNSGTQTSQASGISDGKRAFKNSHFFMSPGFLLWIFKGTTGQTKEKINKPTINTQPSQQTSLQVSMLVPPPSRKNLSKKPYRGHCGGPWVRCGFFLSKR